ncbi:hypothetical protein EIB18_18600 [Caulobacter vibrioides]|uniref:Uncharacterized protein n=1 Tax=Caulobacter vibrioides (strain NA1000 / CB15N) TaxID=565050 RepID=A0A0H3CDL8_CAUVN|nr:hypothetical protein [Caulobacter vibrioides]YP_002519004.1 hypothetical protein CCNA_03631 [Caulobacter vibrioides NA1000]ACL97096.1 hypothetical protein CCNA_03631 [Caulobacter vibrioides NA1000]AVH77109.1 hypothetical protein CA607_20630 [Caulobacter vibrioides]AZH14507.1 hypothetical protein EIB18_18600 [Caulobacter vibrioides]QXZ51857.1 hypothetical protein KZH45_18595 [Caulobacter vibrioides]
MRPYISRRDDRWAGRVAQGRRFAPPPRGQPQAGP